MTFIRLAVAACFVTWVVACQSSSSEEPADCAVGTEGCPCTQGGACDPGLSCLSSLCVDTQGSGGSATGGSTNTGGSTSTGGGTGTGGSTSTGGTSGSGSGGTTSTGGTSGSTGCSPGNATCGFPIDAADARRGTESLALEFKSGSLASIDGECCVPDATPAAGDWGSWPCKDGFKCGDCLVYLIDPDPQATINKWFLVDAAQGTSGAVQSCAGITGVYDVCIPDCTGKICGNDGCNGSCGACSGSNMVCNASGSCEYDACGACLDNCTDLGLPGCCTGAGCLCEGDC